MAAFHSQDALVGLIAKANYTLTTITDGGSYLLEEQAARYIRLMLKESRLLRQLDNQSTDRPKKTMAKVGFLGEVLRPERAGVALSEAELSTPTHEFVEVEPTPMRCSFAVNRPMLEDNIERDTLLDTLREELARAATRDLEKAVLQGDTDTATPGSLLSLFDGLIKQTITNLVPLSGVALDHTVLGSLFKVLDDEYLDKSRQRFWTCQDAEQDYRDSIGARATNSGDQAFGATPSTAALRVAYNGVVVEPLHLMPTDLGDEDDETVVMLFDPMNAALVWRRQILLETDYDAKAGVWTVIMSMRCAPVWKEERGVAMATGVLASAA